MAGELLPVATVANQTGRVVGEVAEAMKNSVENLVPSLKPLVNIDTPDINNITMPDPEGDFSNINDPHNTKRTAENPEILRADEGHNQRNGTFVKDHNTTKNIQASIDETLTSPISLPERIKPNGANTIDNRNGDALANALRDAEERADINTALAQPRTKKEKFIDTTRIILETLGNSGATVTEKELLLGL
jgi:hypothetical protein